MALNSKHALFVKEYLVDQNASRAYKVVYPKSTDKAARAAASRLLTNGNVKAAIEKGLAEQAAKVEERIAAKGVTKERWVEELSRLAFANMDDFMTIEARPTFNGRSGKKHYVATALPKLTKDRPKELGHAIKKISETKNGIGLELHSKQAALELLGRHFGWVKNDLGVAPASNVQVILTLPANGREAKKDDET